jgi:Short C-terminal domain
MNEHDEMRRAVREMVDELGRAAEQAAKLVREAVGDLTRFVGRESAPSPEAPVASLTADPFEAIRELAKLRDEGLISDAEFTAKKSQIMERL